MVRDDDNIRRLEKGYVVNMVQPAVYKLDPMLQILGCLEHVFRRGSGNEPPHFDRNLPIKAAVQRDFCKGYRKRRPLFRPQTAGEQHLELFDLGANCCIELRHFAIDERGAGVRQEVRRNA